MRQLIVAVAVVSLGACGLSQDEDGVGYLTVADLANPARPGHFTGAAGPVTAELRVKGNGCVNVIVDGVERVPIWPRSTEVAPDTDAAGYTVDLPGSLELHATTTNGDRFEAAAVIDDEVGPTGGPTPDDSKVGSLVGYCGIGPAPIAFFDASSIHPHP